MSVRVGIAINPIDNLSNWELRIIKEIIDDSELELSLLIEDDLIDHTAVSNFLGIPMPKYLSANLMGRLLLSIQLHIEQTFFFKQTITVEVAELSLDLKKVKKVKRSLWNIDSTKLDNTGVAENTALLKLDVLLDLSANHGLKEYASLTKYGVWTLIHKDVELKAMGPIGFWEVLNKKETIGCSLLGQNSESDKIYSIDKANFNRHWSCIETKNIALEASVSVVLKNIRRLGDKDFEFDKCQEHIESAERLPTLLHVLKYIVGFKIGFAKKIVEKVRTKLFGTRFECWTFNVGQGQFLDVGLQNYKTAQLPKGEFWADPFLFKYNGLDYVFFENYSYKTNRGKISCAVIKNNELQHIEDALDLDYHLSFPYIFEEGGVVYLMPETSENKRLEIYKAVDFPTKWELYSTAFEGEAVADAFFYTDLNKEKWLFLNKQAASVAPMNSELFIYKVASLKLNNLQSHTQNPVIIDARVARNGGAIFEHDKQVYRPSQRNVDGIYGRALNINKIKELTLNSYIEETEKVIEPEFDKNFVAMHHLHQTEDFFVFDSAFKKK